MCKGIKFLVSLLVLLVSIVDNCQSMSEQGDLVISVAENYPNATSSQPIQTFVRCMIDNGIDPTSIVDKHKDPRLYNQLNHQWNERLPKIYPLAYFLPKTTLHVQQCVRCGLKSNIPLVPKSGGHSYEGYSFGNSKTIVIDFRKMNQVKIDSIEKTAIIQSGALLGSVNMKLWLEGGFGIPTGNCLTVGIGGQTLGGGVGYFTHLYGMTLDNVLELKMVDAKGNAHRVNDIENPDLYWALRGIGSGYVGIVTEFKFKLHYVKNLCFTLVRLAYDRKHFPEVLYAWQTWMLTKQKEFGSTSGIYVRGKESENGPTDVEVRLLLSEPIAELSKNPEGPIFFEQILNVYPECYTNASMKTNLSYMDIITETSYPLIINKTTTNVQKFSNLVRKTYLLSYFLKAQTFYVNKTFSKRQIEVWRDILKDLPRSVVLLFAPEIILPFDVAPQATAYVHRNSLYSLTTHTEGNNENWDEGLKWSDKFIQRTKFMDNGESYQNFVDEGRKDFLVRYYGINLGRLISIKQKWDPQNYFQNPQSIPLSLE